MIENLVVSIRGTVHQHRLAVDLGQARLVETGEMFHRVFGERVGRRKNQNAGRLQQPGKRPQSHIQRWRDVLQNVAANDEIVLAELLLIGPGQIEPRFPIEERVGVTEVALKPAGVDVGIADAQAANAIERREITQLQVHPEERAGQRQNDGSEAQGGPALGAVRSLAVGWIPGGVVPGSADVAGEPPDGARRV